jgi:hypothetical protein
VKEATQATPTRAAVIKQGNRTFALLPISYTEVLFVNQNNEIPVFSDKKRGQTKAAQRFLIAYSYRKRKKPVIR